MPITLARLCLVVFCSFFVACGSKDESLLRLDPGPDSMEPSAYVTQDPDGPIRAPNLPPALSAAAEQAEAAAREESPRAPLLRYTLIVNSPDAPKLKDVFLNVSVLEQLRDRAPETLMGLDQRMRADLETARDVLHSFGYYAGEVHGRIKPTTRGERSEKAPGDGPEGDGGRPRRRGRGSRQDQPREYVVTVTFEPGIRYTIGKTRVAVTDPDRLRPDPTKGKYIPPSQTLAELGLNDGDPAIANDVLNAVSAAHEQFRDRGFPFASIASSRYILDHSNQTLEVDLVVDSGPLVYMDDLEVKGESPVSMHNLTSMRTWEPGQPWNQSLVENYRAALRRGGLFSAVELNPAAEDNKDGQRAVEAELTAAPPRTVGGALKFDTDFGPGVQAYWLHRNITGRGDRLRIEMPLWTDLQELVATYRLPFFLHRSQDFTASAAYRNEDTDAYELTSYTTTAGLERRFSPRWTGAMAVHLEGGELKDPGETRTSYMMVGLPTTLRYDNTGSLLDATRGVRLNLGVAPYTGEFHEDFTVVRTRIEGQAFIPVIGENALVLALRAMYGFLSDTDAQDVPASIRFYTGGGGSVRGYAYQSLGPRNDDRDPLGGASALELSAEARMRFNETWGMVAFLDGGMAYEDAMMDFGKKTIRWGAGLGARIFTVIGPIRLDVAVPLNPRRDDDDLQIYFSIGQSF